MTVEVNMYEFLLRQKLICTQSPLKTALGPDLHRELRAKYKLELGLDLLADRCDNVFNCLSAGEGCIGRPFPLDDDIRSALGDMNVEVSIGNHKGREVYFAKAITLCEGCPFQSSCEATCPTQDSYLNRSVNPDSNPPESSLVPYEDYEKGLYKALTPEDMEHCEYGDWINEQLPLDCLTPKQRQVIEMTLYQGLDQVTIAGKLGIGKDVVSRHKSAALSKLKEYGKARKVIREKGAPIRVIEYYVNNLTLDEIAAKSSVSKQAVEDYLSRWRSRNYL